MENELQNLSETPQEILIDSTAVKQKDFNNYKLETEKILNEIKAQAESAVDPFGSSVGYVSIAAVVLALLAAILAIAFKSVVSGNLNKVIKNSNSQGEKIKELSEQISRLETEIEILKKDTRQQKQLLEKNNSVNANFSPAVKNISAVPNVNSIPSAANNPPPRPVVEEWQDFVKDFNSLPNQSGYEQKKVKDDFLRKYDVKAFSCTNFDVRMNEPVPPPQFGTVASLQNADYWAYEFESGTFAVVPNVKTYTENHHSARAMGEVFESNYQGGTCSKIRVDKPAIFKGMWTLEKSGKLELR